MESDEYQRIAEVEEAHWWYVAMRQIAETLTADLIPTADGMFLDAGCGPGGNAQWLATRGSVFGIDVMPEAIDFASDNHPGLKLARATVEAVPFRDKSFDLIQSITVLSHQAVSDELAALAEYHRVTKPGGIVVIAEPAFSVLRRGHDRVVHVARRYTRRSLARLAATAGFEVVRTTYAYSYLFPATFILAMYDRIRPSPAGRSDLERGNAGAKMFRGAARAEIGWLRRGLRVPFGVTAIVIARRPAQPGQPA